MKTEIKVTFGIIIGAILLAYYGFVIAPVNQKNVELKAKQLKEQTARAEYDSCVNVAYESYSNDWDLNCDLQGKEKDCSLTGYVPTALDVELESAKKTCLEKYEIFVK